MLRSVAIAFAFTSSAAFALPINAPRVSGHDLSVIANQMGVSYDFEGIVQLSNCSGALVRYESSQPGDKGIVLTNGHCVDYQGDMIPPNRHLINELVTRQFSLLSRDGQSRVGTVSSSKILYATMTGTDMALYELKETFEQISSRFGVDALTLANVRPDAGTIIEIISGYWRRGYGCKVDGFVHELREAGYKFTDSIRYEINGGCKTIHGTSGSPIIEGGTRTVIGVNNTGNDDGGKCTMNNPCEVDENGKVTAVKGRSYGQQTWHVYTCLNDRNQLDLSRDGCKLFRNPAPQRL